MKTSLLSKVLLASCLIVLPSFNHADHLPVCTAVTGSTTSLTFPTSGANSQSSSTSTSSTVETECACPTADTYPDGHTAADYSCSTHITTTTTTSTVLSVKKKVAPVCNVCTPTTPPIPLTEAPTTQYPTTAAETWTEKPTTYAVPLTEKPTTAEVYTSSKPTTAAAATTEYATVATTTETPATHKWEYKGCYDRKPDKNVALSLVNEDDAQTVEKCVKAGKAHGYGYVYLKRGKECWGNIELQADYWTSSSSCDKKCSGADNEWCGGDLAANVYECK